MTDLFLFTATESDMKAALLAANVIDDKGKVASGIDVEHIGPFVRDSVEYVDWHTNLRGAFSDEQLAALDPLRIYPTLPYRVFA